MSDTLTLDHPFDEPEARNAARMAAALQAGCEGQIREAFSNFAEKEHAYRKALATRIAELHADGTAWTACGDLARGDERVARLRMERDIAEGVKEAAMQASWRRAADRKDIGRLIEWSARRDLAAGVDPEDAAPGVVFGSRRAA